MQIKTAEQRERISCAAVIGILGLFSIAACLPLLLEIFSLFLYFWLPGVGLRQLLRLLYLPQFGVIGLAIVSIVSLGYAVKKQSLGRWNTYLPLVMLIIYCFVVMATSYFVLQYSIHTKIDSPDDRRWSEAMVGRSFAGYPTGVTCRLNDHVDVMVREWSFITPDGHMPVLAWSESSFPASELTGNPVDCRQLQPTWYVCYLSRPYQLIINDNVCG